MTVQGANFSMMKARFALMPKYARPRLHGSENGQSLVELALLLPVLLLLMVGIVDLGHAFHGYTTLVNAAREGARYAAVHPTDSAGIRDAVQQETQNSNVDLSSSTIEISVPAGTSPGDPIRVLVTHQFPLVTGIILASRTISISASATMMIE